ncbi:CocE/NonD family hydrolase [Nocardia sp. NBC_01377]|uniref:CocE/NonD family hydrolase n=1 Tax=Nocardia sp. NBC_01377 TaxID=2903595 RepID=UPI003245A95D
MRTRMVGVVLVLAMCAVVPPSAGADTTAYPGGWWAPEPATYAAAVDPVEMVPMDDGVKLRVQIVYPTDPMTGARARGPFPVLLTQTPYSTTVGVTSNAPVCDDSVIAPLESLPGLLGAARSVVGPCPGDYFAKRGYIVVQSDQRGTGLSEGDEWGMFGPRDARDGAAIALWASKAANIPESSGQVGLFGCSAMGISQLVTAAELGRRYGADQPVKAMVPGCITGGMYRDTAFDNGIPAPVSAMLSAKVVQDATRWPATPDSWQRATHSIGPDIFLGGDSAYERQFWQDRKIADQAGDIVKSGARALIYVGWQEGGFIGALDLYGQLQNAWAGRDQFGPMLPGQRATGRYQLMIGPGAHGCCLNDPGVQLQFFDHWLKGKDTGIDDTTTTPIHAYERGGDRYVNLSNYPFTDDYTSYRLGNATLAATPSEGGVDRLAWGPPSDAGTSRSYLSEPLREGATIAGPISVTVYAASSTTNLRLVATMSDVAADGSATEITHGSLLASLSDLDASRSWTSANGAIIRPYPSLRSDDYKPAGEVVRYDVALQPALFAVAEGHRIRLTLATQPDPAACGAAVGLGAPIGCLSTATQAATLGGGVYEIWRDDRYPSALHLPLLPYRRYSTVPSDATPTSSGYAVPRNWG